METEGKERKRVVIEVQLQTQDDAALKEHKKIAVYAFSQGGKLLDHARIEKGGDARLKIRCAEGPVMLRVLVGPRLKKEQISLTELLRRAGEERQIRIAAGQDALRLLVPLIPDSIRCWLQSGCVVRGTLLKRTMVDGMPVDLPVCGARVAIYEVDPFPLIIGRLPEEVLRRIRDVIRGWPPVVPEPPKPPLPGPRPDPMALEQPAATGANAFLALREAISPPIRLAAGGDNLDRFRQALVREAVELKPVLWPLLCLYYPFPLNKQEVASAITDDCGRFTAFFFNGCNNPDTPDLYFTASQPLFGGLSVSIYRPTPVNCHTHWNYQCGSEVTLYTRSPLARACAPCAPVAADNHWVLVRAIGDLPLSRIRGCSRLLASSTTTGNKGLNLSLGDDLNGFDGRPFGGTLRLRVEFDNSLRDELGVRYYRVSFRRGESGAFTPLTTEVHRHYTHEVGSALVEEVYSLGPRVVGGTPDLFEIPPALPPKGQWSIPSLKEDLINAKFLSQSLAPAAQQGLYQFKIDLFDSSGNLVDIDNLGGQRIHYVVPRDWVPSLAAVLATDEAEHVELDLVRDDDGDGLKSFIMPLYVDNSPCEAAIGLPRLDGVFANNCGVMAYHETSANVDVPYTALHPNGFASYSFGIHRGITLLQELERSGVASGNYVASMAYTEMLSEDCPMAGFSAHLHVRAWATDGYGRLSGYDRNAHVGFALAPDS